MKFSKNDNPPKYYEVLDQLRNGHDRLLRRGYDYDTKRRYEEHISKFVTFVLNGNCIGCGNPAGIMLPNGPAYCGPCLRNTADYKAKKQAKEERYGIRDETRSGQLVRESEEE